jgi:catechol 2,3-dioxygenase-like lactoylglutathione lyase family enzyme
MKFHTSLPVRDITSTVEFYSALFGEAPAKLRVDYAKFLPRSVEVNLTFHQARQGAGLLTDLHLGFELPTQAALDEAHARLAEAGFVTDERKTSVCCYANQDKFWITDPNGYRWELYYLVNDADYKIDRTDDGCCATSEGAPGCC